MSRALAIMASDAAAVITSVTHFTHFFSIFPKNKIMSQNNTNSLRFNSSIYIFYIMFYPYRFDLSAVFQHETTPQPFNDQFRCCVTALFNPAAFNPALLQLIQVSGLLSCPVTKQRRQDGLAWSQLQHSTSVTLVFKLRRKFVQLIKNIREMSNMDESREAAVSNLRH